MLFKKAIFIVSLSIFSIGFFFFSFSVSVRAQACVGNNYGQPGNCTTIANCVAANSDTSASCTGANIVCCAASALGGPPQNTVGTPVMAGTYANPLAISGTPVQKVEDLLVALLLFFQRIIVILAVVFIIIGALIYITSAGNESRVTWAKGAILAAVLGLAIAIAAPLFLREIGAILGWSSPSPNLGSFGTQLTLTQVLGNILSFLLGILGVVGLIGLILGAFMYLTSAGDTDRADTGKKIITYAIIGIVVALAGLVIIRQVATFF